MDGRQGRLKDSLQFRLAASLSALVIALAIGAGAFSFWTAFEEANELQDDQLRQMAALVEEQGGRARTERSSASEPVEDADSQFVVQVLGYPTARAESRPSSTLVLPTPLADGLQTRTIGHEPWRLFVRPLGADLKAVVGQRIAARDEVARNGALRTVLPLIALVPILLLLVTVVVRQAIHPVVALARELDRRTEDDLSSLRDDRVPNEIRSFTASINRLLARVTSALLAQRRFVADAAHELRTPLTVLLLQAEALAGGKELTESAQGRAARLRQGIERVRSLLEQLLTLARFEAAAGVEIPPSPISTLDAVRAVIEEQLPVAEAKHIDLGVVADEVDVFVAARGAELHSLLRNLVDNAVRYTPPGGRVDVSLRRTGGAVTIEVVDSGPGIPLAEQERVFDPFYRVLGTDSEGSGLGLSIVKTLAMRMGITVRFAEAEPERPLKGLRVVVSFPASLVTLQVTLQESPDEG